MGTGYLDEGGCREGQRRTRGRMEGMRKQDRRVKRTYVGAGGCGEDNEGENEVSWELRGGENHAAQSTSGHVLQMCGERRGVREGS